MINEVKKILNDEEEHINSKIDTLDEFIVGDSK